MNTKAKFEIQKIRSFGDIIGDAFKVVTRNYQVFFKALLVYVFPVFILSSIAIYFFGGEAANALTNPDLSDPMGILKSVGLGMGLYYIGMLICMFFVMHITLSIVLGLKENGGDKLAYEVFQENFNANLGSNLATYLVSVVGLFIIFLAGAMIAGLLFSVSGFLGGLVAFALFFFAFWVIIIFQFPIIINNDKKLGPIESVKQSFELINGRWWYSFGIILVLGIIISMIGYIFVLPIQILQITEMVTTGLEGGNPELGSLGALSLIFSLLGSILTYTIFYSGLALYYYSIIELKEGGSLFNRINTIGNQEDSFFENEGEF
jgi:hypothetical protein